MTGSDTAALMWRAVSRFSVMVSRFTSGIARWAADTAKLDDHTSGKPAASMRRAESASWAPTMGTSPGRRRSERNREALVMMTPLARVGLLGPGRRLLLGIVLQRHLGLLALHAPDELGVGGGLDDLVELRA